MNDVALLDRAKGVRPQGDNPASPLLLTAKQVADLLGTSKRQVWRLESAGRIPKPVRLGGRLVRWRWTDLVGFVDQLGTDRRRP
jgi:excisionase family DNA binding protein